MRKTNTKLVDELLKQHQETVIVMAGWIKVKETLSLENIQPWLQETSIDTIIGRIEGHTAMLENVLHQQNCYRGFNYIDSKGNWLILIGMKLQDHPEYREYLRRYY